jgi:glycosyltransferase involved in cell wall biosynthesis
MIFSVIMPVYNDPSNLNGVLSKLSQQQIDKSQFEIIIVDNGSDVDYSSILSNYIDVNIVFLREEFYRNSPYSSRNRGVEVAKGFILVFLDVTCWPNINWLLSAEAYFANIPDCKILAGEVYFRSKNLVPNVAEIVDSCENIRMKDSVEKNSVAKTANLFIHRSVFDELGLFPEGIRSGGDIEFTSKASKFGFLIHFSDKAYVYKEARSFSELMLKQKRVGLGHARAKGLSLKKVSTYLGLFQLVIPPNPFNFRNKVINKNKIGITSLSVFKAIGCYTCYYAFKISLFKGQIMGLFNLE